jgi:hypothetical protein
MLLIAALLNSWLPTETYHKKSGDLKKNSLQNLANLGHFFHGTKILCIGRNHIFHVKNWPTFASKRNTDSSLCL